MDLILLLWSLWLGKLWGLDAWVTFSIKLVSFFIFIIINSSFIIFVILVIVFIIIISINFIIKINGLCTTHWIWESSFLPWLIILFWTINCTSNYLSTLTFIWSESIILISLLHIDITSISSSTFFFSYRIRIIVYMLLSFISSVYLIAATSSHAT
jgi:hypothetical protein